jgi:hypothetical protein
MADVTVRPDAIDVEQIMQQLRTRIRERRAAVYTETEVHQLATAKLDQLLDARGAHPKLAEQFLRERSPSPDVPTYEFEGTTIFATHRGLLRVIRTLLRPILKLFLNPDPLSRALHLQAKINAEFQRRFRQREEMDPLLAEVIRGLVVEVTRASLEVQSLKLRLESLSTRMDFDERRARSREGAPPVGLPRAPVADQPPATENPTPVGGDRPDPRTSPGSASPGPTAPGGERRRRRRRRRRRGSAGQPQPAWGSSAPESSGAETTPGESAGLPPEEGDLDSGSFDVDEDTPESDEP